MAVSNLSLCSGGAGLDLGLELALGAVRTVCWVEWEAFACEFLASRMEEGCLPEAPIWTDVRSFQGRQWRGIVDSITAGYPCQPFSVAGRRHGQTDPRHLWPHVCRIIGEVEPSIVYLENVGGHLSLGAEQVLSELQAMGYEVAAGLFTAAEVGAPHKRERLFILGLLADARDLGCGDTNRTADDQGREPARTGASDVSAGRKWPNQPDSVTSTTSASRNEPMADAGRGRWGQCQSERGSDWRKAAGRHGSGSCSEVADALRDGGSRSHGEEGFGRGVCEVRHSAVGNAHDECSEGRPTAEQQAETRLEIGLPLFPPGPKDNWSNVPEYRWPAIEPGVCQLVDGLAHDRTRYLKLLGNGVVPLQAAYAFLSLYSALRFNPKADQ